MRFLAFLLLSSILLLLAACVEREPATPLKTLQTYQKAVKQKDTTTMKLLLSSETIKMMEQEAKSQGVPLDNIVERESLFPSTQKTVEFRNQTIEGERATLEIKNSSEEWETWPFVFEDGGWKIDKKGFADRLMDEIQKQQDAAFEELRNQSEIPVQPSP